MKTLSLLSFFLLFTALLSAKTAATVPDSMLVYTPEDVEIFAQYINEFSENKDLPDGELLLKTGEFLLETPYVGFTLEVAAPAEKLIINLRELDCTTFAETVLALARTLKSATPTFKQYADELRNIRYRGGKLDGFVSRLHYFSDWIYDNEKMGIVQDMTKQAGGKLFNVRAFLMSKISKNYRQLAADTTLIAPIRSIEKKISSRKHYFIPKTALNADAIQDGDILAMTTGGNGIEIMHMGFAVKRDGVVYFMHASSNEKKVMITEEPFVDYLKKLKSNTGFMIVRPVF
jgi:hypothetical protein